MCDVRKRAAVDERGRAFKRLDEIGLQRILQKRRHRTDRLEVCRRDGLLVVGVADDDLSETLLQILDRGGETEHRHDLGRNGDVVAVLTRYAVDAAAEAVGHVAQLTVVHIDTALPRNAARVDVQRVALIDVVVEHCGKQIVRRADRVEVTRKMQVDVLHRNDLCVTAACGTALDAEYRPERRLTERNDDVLSDTAHTVRKSDRRGGLALAGRGRRDRRHENELAVSARAFTKQGIVHLRLVFSVLLQIFVVNARARRDRRDRLHFYGMCDLNITFHL